jgi:hypothetical protein
MVSEHSMRVVFVLDDRFAEKDEGPSDGDVVGGLPLSPDSFERKLSPDSFERFLGALRRGAFEQAMESGFFHVKVAYFASRLNSHELQPGANREALIERQPDEGSHLSWARIVPNASNHLRGCGIPESEILQEG